jgi:hypothetical protein
MARKEGRAEVVEYIMKMSCRISQESLEELEKYLTDKEIFMAAIIGGGDTMTGGNDTMTSGNDTMSSGNDTMSSGNDTMAGGFSMNDFIDTKWKETIPDTLKDREEFKRVDNIQKLYENYIEAQKTISSSVRVPDQNATPEDLNKFYERIGKPKTKDEYKIEVPKDILDKGVNVQQDLSPWFRERAFERNLTAQQAEGLYQDFVNQQLTQVQKMQQEISNDTAKAIDALKSEWGGDYQKNIDFINSKLGMLYDEATISALRNNGMLRDTGFIKNIYKLTKAVSGDMVYIDGKPLENAKETLDSLTVERDKLLAEDHVKNAEAIKKLNVKIVTIKQAQQQRPSS